MIAMQSESNPDSKSGRSSVRGARTFFCCSAVRTICETTVALIDMAFPVCSERQRYKSMVIAPASQRSSAIAAAAPFGSIVGRGPLCTSARLADSLAGPARPQLTAALTCHSVAKAARKARQQGAREPIHAQQAAKQRPLHERTDESPPEIAEAGEAVALGVSTPKGGPRVSAPVAFAHVALGRTGARFAFAYPRAQLAVVAEDRTVHAVEAGYELVIRIDPSPKEDLVSRRFPNDECLIVAPPEIKRAAPAAVGEACTVGCLLSTTPTTAVRRLSLGAENDAVLKPEPVPRLSPLFMVREADPARAGLMPKLLVAACTGFRFHLLTETGQNNHVSKDDLEGPSLSPPFH